jgi:phosphoglycolate phosphatase-like HAD superfamily hydrolase
VHSHGTSSCPRHLRHDRQFEEGFVTEPKLLALDFDGVICDTVREGCRSAWRVCREFLPLDGDAPPPELASRFVRLRPVVEHGWEFPVLVLSILDGIPEATIWEAFQTTCRARILEKYRVTPRQLAARFDAVRDRAIAKSVDDWLADQGLYPGMADRLRAALAGGTTLYVITTKEGRFAHTLLETHGVTMPLDRVWGKEQARPKPELLRVLATTHGLAYRDIWFVEDRLKTLQAVTHEADLADVGLYLALWGYVMPTDRDTVAADPRIVPISLEQFCQDFSAWRK